MDHQRIQGENVKTSSPFKEERGLPNKEYLCARKWPVSLSVVLSAIYCPSEKKEPVSHPRFKGCQGSNDSDQLARL